MTPRLEPFAAAPTAMQSWLAWSTTTMQTGLEPKLMELVKIRASQLNGCAFCLDMVAQTHAPDDAYDDVHKHFTPEEQVQLTLLIVAINGRNRIQVGFRGIHPVRSEAA